MVVKMVNVHLDNVILQISTDLSNKDINLNLKIINVVKAIEIEHLINAGVKRVDVVLLKLIA